MISIPLRAISFWWALFKQFLKKSEVDLYVFFLQIDFEDAIINPRSVELGRSNLQYKGFDARMLFHPNHPSHFFPRR